MGSKDVIVIIIIGLIIGCALLYVIKAKKSGKKCIGCPYSGACQSQKSGACSCGCGASNKEVKPESANEEP